MARKRSKTAAATGAISAQSGPAPNAPSIKVWEDDPEPAVLVVRPVPDLAQPLAFAITGRKFPPAVYQPGTPQFRYWVAAEALRRGADFWKPHLGVTQWEVGRILKVILDEGAELNAYYDREALNFFHGPGQGGTIYSGESPDVVCHEMGHAILDTIKPQLWGAASAEAAAFHESFADMSAILSALQLPSLRNAILTDTQGHLYRNSRLSRLAEQLGTAIRLRAPDTVDRDCLRNAVNSFIYQDPVNLPQMAPATQLSSEAHSFSRVFTGAFFEILSSMLDAKAATRGQPTEQELLGVTGDMADILIEGVKQAPVVANWYAQVAAAMVQASAQKSGDYPPILKAVFVRRSILSLRSAAEVEDLRAVMTVPAERAAVASIAAPLASMALAAWDYGLNQPLLVEAASHPRRLSATSAATAGDGALEPASSSTAARSFVNDLFSCGRVDYGELGRKEARLEHGTRQRSHRLVTEGKAVRLQRCLFHCGFTH
jgi:hypothetical protein